MKFILPAIVVASILLAVALNWYGKTHPQMGYLPPNQPPSSPHGLKLRWEAVPGASAYAVKVWQKDAHGQTISLADPRVTGTEVVVQPRLKGDVYWQVAAIDANGMKGESSEVRTVSSSQ